MNVLSLMQFVPADSNYAAQVKTLVEQRHRLPLSALVSLFFTYEELDLMSQQAADGGRTAGSDDLGLLYGFPVKTDCQVLFSVGLCGCHNTSVYLSRIIRVTRIGRGVNLEYSAESLTTDRVPDPCRICKGRGFDFTFAYGTGLGMDTVH